MKQYGLIGYPLSHSFSKKYFTDKFERAHITDSEYQLFPIEHISELPALIKRHPDLCGLNVTIPHKQNVLKYLDWVEGDAKRIGAVNCIRITGNDDRLEGFNTDLYGFEMSLKPLLTNKHDHALVLGDGGAAQAVKCVLENLGIAYKVVTRKPQEGGILFKDLGPHHIKDNLLIINTTPLGMSPHIDECPPIPYECITDDHLLYDLVYNPEKTVFLQKGEERGAMIKNGLEMLILQAEKSWEIWTAKDIHSA
ncbi:MAG TPA: shikimate dehydrogenase [Mucilaginibacter sp.]|jgi:shikimate dehydrogenase|nr:shikimate dehydrogenase [Mucilaginibacter sp.]